MVYTRTHRERIDMVAFSLSELLGVNFSIESSLKLRLNYWLRIIYNIFCINCIILYLYCINMTCEREKVLKWENLEN